MSPLEAVAALLAVVSLVVALMTLLEKLTGAGQRWLARGVEAGTRTLREDINDVKADAKETATAVAQHGVQLAAHEELHRVHIERFGEHSAMLRQLRGEEH